MKDNSNIFEQIPSQINQEIFQDLITGQNIRIERIISHGQTSPHSGWYQQTEHEWVIVLQGHAILTFDNNIQKELKHGDYLNIPAGTRHRVSYTCTEQKTIWLAIFYS